MSSVRPDVHVRLRTWADLGRGTGDKCPPNFFTFFHHSKVYKIIEVPPNLKIHRCFPKIDFVSRSAPACAWWSNELEIRVTNLCVDISAKIFIIFIPHVTIDNPKIKVKIPLQDGDSFMLITLPTMRPVLMYSDFPSKPTLFFVACLNDCVESNRVCAEKRGRQWWFIPLFFRLFLTFWCI